MAYFRWLLLPFSIVYGLGIWIRNRCYDWGWFKSTGFKKPVIVVGNLAVGGTGKSPMTEYLVKLLRDTYKVATLSRGYGRKTRGFLTVSMDGTVEDFGDEPLQFKHKFPETTIAVDENRVRGVGRLFESGHEAVILDDAYQHRALKPGIAILLFDYRSLSQPKWLLPAGDYRDSFRERHRADVVIVTKTPFTATETEKRLIHRSLGLDSKIPVLFSSIRYAPWEPLIPNQRPKADLRDKKQTILLVTGIANPTPLYDHLKSHAREIIHLRYPDHYSFTLATLRAITTRFDEIPDPSKVIVTTEKDAQRLLAPTLAESLAGLPIYRVPIQVQFNEYDDGILQQLVLGYCAAASRVDFV